MGAAGVEAAPTRTALTRVKSKGLVESVTRDRKPGYALTPDAEALLARGDRRIERPRAMQLRDPWCLLSFSLPESDRSVRHQLRKRLSWIGAGHVSQALWIVPAYLREEVESIVIELGIAPMATIFVVSDIHHLDVPIPVLLREWWDLDALRAIHDGFLESQSAQLAALTEDSSPASAFGIWIRALDAWRPIPYFDPGIPAELLPADWPGAASSALYLALRSATKDQAAAFVASVLRQADGTATALDASVRGVTAPLAG